VVHLIDDHQLRRLAVQQSKRQDFEVRPAARVRRFALKAIYDLRV